MRHITIFFFIALNIIIINLSFAIHKDGIPSEYLIVTPAIFADSLQPLIDSKISQGLSVYLATLDQIQTDYAGRDIQEKIRSCIKDRYLNHNAYWVLLVGKPDADDSPDTNSHVNQTVLDKPWEMPIRYVYSPDPNMNMVYIPTDNYYSCLDGDWDMDGDNIFGENAVDCTLGISEVDWLPDVCLGRIPCENVSQLSSYIRKILSTDYSNLALSQLNSLQIFCKIDSNQTDLNVPGKILANILPYDTASINNINSELNNDSYPLMFFTGHGNMKGISLTDGIWTGDQLRDGGSKFFAYIAGCEVGQSDGINFDPSLDQSQPGINSYYFILNTTERWQEFKPTVSSLSKVGLAIWKFGSPGNLIVKIATSSGVILQEQSIDPSLIVNTTVWLGVNISPPLTLTPDSTYRIIVTSDPSVYPDIYAWYGQTSSSYTRGISSVEGSSPGFDFAFATNATDPSMSFAENILFKPNSGAIGCVAAWRLSSPLGQVDLWEEFVRAFFDGSNTYVGEAFKQAERTFYSTFMYWNENWYQYWHYTSLIYELYGDPGQKIGSIMPNGPQIVSVPRVLSPYNSDYKYNQNSMADAIGRGKISWQKIYGPDYFTISDSGLVSWVPQIGEPGNGGRPEICIQASDSNGSTRQRWVVQCGEEFRIISSPVESASVGIGYVYSPSTTAGQNVTWKKLAGPEDLTVDINTGAVSWIPQAAGKNEVILQAFSGISYKTPEPQRYEIIVQQPLVNVCVDMQAGWNLCSIPEYMADWRKHLLYPTAVSQAFEYHGSYIARDTLANGLGFWLKFAGDTSICFAGKPIESDTLSLVAGWNIIGSISKAISVHSIVSVPPGVVTSPFFGYRSSYIATDSIYPGHGYWLKVSDSCDIILSPGSVSSQCKIKISSTSELPPPPPAEVRAAEDLPAEYRLEQAFPSPFNPTTTIKYQLPHDSRVSLFVYNTLGQVVAVLADGIQQAGYKSVQWNASSVPSGVYFYRLVAGDFIQVKKALLIR